jgi:hypothetical protein
MHSYDFVTIQQVRSQSFKPESFQPHADKLSKFIKTHAPTAKMIIHQTWAYSPDSDRLKNWNMSRKEMHEGLVANYRKLAERYNTFILPSGSAFYRSFQRNPDIDLWSKDKYHASDAGCYLAGCVWFGVLFDKNPNKIKFKPSEMTPDDARHLRKVANKVSKKQRKNRKQLSPSISVDQ